MDVFDLKYSLIVTIVLMIIHCDVINGLKYLWGDALEDPKAVFTDGTPYPWDISENLAKRHLRHGRNFEDDSSTDQSIISPERIRNILLEGTMIGKGQGLFSRRQGRSQGNSSDNSNTNTTTIQDEFEGCVPSRLCQSSYNTTAPLFGISLTSGKPVTIVQKFPDLLQQVVFQVCKTKECEVLQGECVQTFIPYLFLVLPLGPVSITGQDYVLVESGCTCQPKYAKKHHTPPIPFIQPIP